MKFFSLNQISIAIFILITSNLFAISPLKPSTYVLTKDGTIFKQKYLASLSPEEHFAKGIDFIDKSLWSEAFEQFKIISVSFPDTLLSHDSEYYVGLCHFKLKEYDLANQDFNRYLKKEITPKFFEEVIKYKFQIAEAFRQGARRHLFHLEQFPKWISGKGEAIDIYDEIVAAMPSHPLAVKSLYTKGLILSDQRQYKDSIEVFQNILSHYPSHEIVPYCYKALSEVYLRFSKKEYQNSDIVVLAQLNAQRFEQLFPNDGHLDEIKHKRDLVEEVYAEGLYETGELYKRKKMPEASVIYYFTVIKQFPNSKIAQECQKRLEKYKNLLHNLDIPDNHV